MGFSRNRRALPFLGSLLLVLALVAVGTTPASAATETEFGVKITGVSPASQKSGESFRYALDVNCDQLGSGSGTEADTCDNPRLTIPLGGDLQALIAANNLSVADFAVDPLLFDGTDYLEGFSIVGGALIIELKSLPVGSSGQFEFAITPRNGTTPNGTEWEFKPTVSGDNFDPVDADDGVAGKATAALRANITKSFQGSGFKDIGDPVDYVLRVECPTTPTGMIFAQTLHVTDTLPADIEYVSSVPNATVGAGGVLSWDLPSSLALPTSCDSLSAVAPKYAEITVQGKVKSSASYGDRLKNTATVEGTTVDGQNIVLAQDDVSITIVDEDTQTPGIVGDFTKDSFGQLRDDDAAPNNAAQGLEANSHTTYPGDWAGARSTQEANILVDYLPNQFSQMRQSGYKMRFLSAQANGAGYQHEVIDPVPCLDNQAGAAYISNAVGDPICQNVAFHVKTVAAYSSTAGGVPVITSTWAPTVRFTDGSSGTLVRTAAGVSPNRQSFALAPADAAKTIAEVTFPRDAGLSGSDVRFGIFGYVDSSVEDLSLVKNIARDTIYYKNAVTPAATDTDDADLRVIKNPQVGIEKKLGAHNSEGPDQSRLTLTSRLSNFAGVTEDFVITDLLPEGMTVVERLGQVNGTITSATPGAPSSLEADEVEVLDNWQGTGRQLIRVTFKKEALDPLESFMMEVGAIFKVKYVNEPGVYANTAQVYYTDDDLMKSCQQSPAYLQQGSEEFDLNENGSTSDKFCYSQASLTVPAPSGGASFKTTKTVQGDNDVAPKSYPAIGRVDEAGGSVVFGLAWKNTGGVPLKGATVYDIFPVVGDKGVGGSVAGKPRNSEFDATFVDVGAVPSNVAVYYSTEANPCRDEVFPDSKNVDCVDDWSLTQPGDKSTITGVKLVSSATYQPGQGFSINVQMTTPPIVQGQIAWNSLAGAAQRLDGLWLNPNSPPKVGLTANSTELPLLIDKTLDSSIDPTTVKVGDTVTYHLSISNADLVMRTLDAEDQLPEGLEFVSIVGAGTPAAPTDKITQADGTITWTGQEVPSGVTYVWTVKAKVLPGAMGTLVNKFGSDDGKPLDECEDDPTRACAEVTVDPVTITIAKTVDGTGTQFAPDEFPFTLVCTVPPSTVAVVDEDFNLADSGSKEFEVPQGTSCKVEETDDGGATDVVLTIDGAAYTPGNAFAVNSTDIEVDATNTFDAGSLVINKVLSGVGSTLPTKKFTFSAACTFNGAPVAGFSPKIVDLTPDSASTTLTSDPLGPLPVGTRCIVTETDSGEADATPSPITVDIVEQGSDNQASVTFTNSFSAGTITVEKALAGDWADSGAVDDVEFTINVTCVYDGNDLFTRAVTLKGGEQVLIESGDPAEAVKLPVGTVCSAEEPVTNGASKAPEIADPVTVTAGSPTALQALKLTVTNTFDAGSLKIAKEVSGVGSPLAKGPFGFAVDCTFEGAPVPGFPTEVTLKLPAGATQVTSDKIGPLPVGASCVTSEIAHGDADNAAPSTTTVVKHGDDGNTVTASFDNPYSAGTIAVAKKLTGKYADHEELVDRVFKVAVTCTLTRGDDEATLVDRTVKVRGGETVTLTRRDGSDLLLPVGTHCWGDEIDDGNADASRVNHGQDNPVSVVAGKSDEIQAMTITANNRFSTLGAVLDEDDKEKGPNKNGVLGNFGSPVGIAGISAAIIAILAGFAMFVAGRRRKGSH